MFTGIVQGLGRIVDIKPTADGTAQTNLVKLPAACRQNLAVGVSIANNGCCLTVTRIAGDIVAFDLIGETLKKTNLGELKTGDPVNIERSLKFGDEIGGHVLSGHITNTLTITKITKSAHNTELTVSFPPEFKEYIFPKGFIALDGCSLTVGEVGDSEFLVHLIPETMRQTVFQYRQIGDRINGEIDSQSQLLVRTVKQFLSSKS